MKTLKPVPRIKLEKIDKILKRDARAHRLVGGYFLKGVRAADPTRRPKTKRECTSVGRCANGSLMFYSDLPLKKIIEVELGAPIPLAFMLREYGLLPIHTSAIIDINDNVDDDENNGKRYGEVMALLTFAEWAQSNGVRFRDGNHLKIAYDRGEWGQWQPL